MWSNIQGEHGFNAVLCFLSHNNHHDCFISRQAVHEILARQEIDQPRYVVLDRDKDPSCMYSS